MRPADSAAQFTFTSTLSRRPLSAWMARATSSLPVPVSPAMRTVESVPATRLMSRNSFLIDFALPTISPTLCSLSISSWR